MWTDFGAATFGLKHASTTAKAHTIGDFMQDSETRGLLFPAAPFLAPTRGEIDCEAGVVRQIGFGHGVDPKLRVFFLSQGRAGRGA